MWRENYKSARRRIFLSPCVQMPTIYFILLLLLLLPQSTTQKSNLQLTRSHPIHSIHSTYRVLILEAVRLVDNHIVPIDLAQLRLLANRDLVRSDAHVEIHRLEAVANQGVLESAAGRAGQAKAKRSRHRGRANREGKRKKEKERERARDSKERECESE